MPSHRTIHGIVDFASKLEGIDVGVLREGLEIARLHREVERAVENDLAGWGLTARQIEIMESLCHNAESVMTPADLSEEVGLTRSAMTSALDSLEKRGHTARALHPTDRRMVAISLTPSGREFIGQRLAERYRKVSRIMEALSKRERALLLDAYRKVLDLLASDMAEISSKAE